MSEGLPTLGIGFEVDTGGSFDEMARLGGVFDSTTAKIEADAGRIERATGGMFAGNRALPEMQAFGSTADRELQRVESAMLKTEKAGERMVRQLEREATAFGKTRGELRSMRAELAATDAESRGLTELAGRLRGASAEMERLEATTGRFGVTAGKSRGTMTQLSFQLNDVATMAALGAPPMQIFASQAGQIFQVAQMAEGGVRGFGREMGALALRFAPVFIAATALTAGLGLLVRDINQGVTSNQLTRDLGDITGGADATKAELYKLRDASVSFGDVTSAVFSEVGKDVANAFVGDMEQMATSVGNILDGMGANARTVLASIYAGAAGTREYLGELEKGGLIGLPERLSDPELIEKTYGAAFKRADSYLAGLGQRIEARAIRNARHRYANQIGYNALPKPKRDTEGERAAREAAAMEAQIEGHYRLADAYGVSGGAALIAEARTKAEADAITKRGDAEAIFSRQFRLSLAERASATAKTTAGAMDQVRMQEKVNAEVRAGAVLASDAAELTRDRIADLPLLAAIEASATTKNYRAVEQLTNALEDQRTARLGAAEAASEERRLTAMQGGRERLAEIELETQLIEANARERVTRLAVLRAEQQAAREGWGGDQAREYISLQVRIADLDFQRQLRTDAFNASLAYQGELLDALTFNVDRAARGLADAFGEGGRALGEMTAGLAGFVREQARLIEIRDRDLAKARENESVEGRIADERRAHALFAARTSTAQIGFYGDMTTAAKGFFKEKSAGYKAMATAEKVFRAVEFAMSVKAMVQDASETISSVFNSTARATAKGTEGVAEQSKLPFPANIAAMAATAAALVAAGVAVFGGGGGGPREPAFKANEGRGTTFGDPEAQSASIKNAIERLREIDADMLVYSRQMASSLRSIENQIGGLANVVIRSRAELGAGAVDSKSSGILGALFGSSRTVVGSGLFAGPQSLESILAGGFNAQTYSDVEKKSKFFGITTGRKTTTQFGAADPALGQQFSLLLNQFNSAIRAAAGPLGASTAEIEARLSGFIVDLGRIDLKGLSGAEVEERLGAVFGAAADRMATTAFPGIERFARAGEGMFETLVRVSSTVEAVTAALDQMGSQAAQMGTEAKLGLADQFDSVGDLTGAIGTYFEAFYTAEEQAAAQMASLTRMFGSLNLTMPETLGGFRQLVEAQDLTSAAGQETYATLLRLAPAFADLKREMDGAKSAADIMSERESLERRLLEATGETTKLRALDLAKLDISNRALQEQIWAIEDARDAARAADDLARAWTSVGDSITAEIARIRGLSVGDRSEGFASLQGRFNAANAAARAGDMEAAKSLPGLSQALLASAEGFATSRQELDRVRAATAAMLETTNGKIGKSGGASPAAIVAAAAVGQAATVPSGAPDNGLLAEVVALREEIARMRNDSITGLAAVAGNTGRIARKLDDVTAASGGDALSVAAAA